MSDARIMLTLDQAEAKALVAMAQADCRHPRDQVRRLIRSEAERLGLWPVGSASARDEVREGVQNARAA